MSHFSNSASEDKAQMVTVIFNGNNKADKDSQNSSTIFIMDGYDGTLNTSASNLALIKLDKPIKKTSNIKYYSCFCNNCFHMSYFIYFRDHGLRYIGLQRN